MLACLDESYSDESGIYLLAMVVIPSAIKRAREATRQILPAGRDPYFAPFHWRHESPSLRRSLICDLILAAQLQVLAFEAVQVRRRAQEEVRRHLLTAAIKEFCCLGGQRITIDGRRSGLNRRDQSTIIAAQQAGKAPPTLGYAFKPPSKEPLIWIPDAVVGAVQADRKDGDSQYLDLLGTHLTLRQ